MKKLEWALWHAKHNRRVFPGVRNSKLPAIKDFEKKATTDLGAIKATWSNGHTDANICVSTQNLIAIDVDVTGDKKGDETLARLEFEDGLTFPPTFTQTTPSGGKHLIYSTPFPVKQGVNVLGPGLDIRAKGGYVVGAGSTIDGQPYTCNDLDIVPAPQWLIDRCIKAKDKKEIDVVIEVDQARALTRAEHYLLTDAPLAIEGQGGDQVTFMVAAALKDIGLTLENAVLLMDGLWNPNCEPPWDAANLRTKIENAYRYGHETPGVAAPEAIFNEIPADEKMHPILELNKEYAFVTLSGRAFILHETTDMDGFFRVEYLTVQTFQQKLLPHTIMFNDKKHQVADLWLRSQDRRTYAGICFMPGQTAPANYYNLWHGFAYEPSDKVSERAKLAVEMLLGHIKENICQGDEEHYRWVVSYFAQLIQKPWQKPPVAIVFKGGKGVGKNFLIECIGELLNGHYVLASDARYLVSNFNSHFENCLLFVLDEAFWSGDKKAEGRLKDLITGQAHQIEKKGAESYKVKNCTRVVIIGNEEWLVPASVDERRFAVFNVGSKRQNDSDFFTEIKTGLRDGGYKYLLKFLSEFDFTKANVNKAPDTIGLFEQKIKSLNPFNEFWLECLKDGRIVEADFSNGWELEVDKDKFRIAYRRFVKERNLRMWGETATAIGIALHNCLPSVKESRKQIEGVRSKVYVLPTLEVAREEWDAYMGRKSEWI